MTSVEPLDPPHPGYRDVLAGGNWCLASLYRNLTLS
jgi:hypothetical protein